MYVVIEKNFKGTQIISKHRMKKNANEAAKKRRKLGKGFEITVRKEE